uniref:Ubiquitin carboxyl-terminal hydrolase 40 n=1 Tax=Geotrypetes seraphini TaxID=260995 RepID=A0A6P8S634_GEOSA|nr:ubiquitin carboxyl-terminal hydrolase 40 [Geotrypetes seraphini]XP_033813519.1 ubiquitin carboxyl-terminal hydrolase 40 [Geotrypetes seraphini]
MRRFQQFLIKYCCCCCCCSQSPPLSRKKGKESRGQKQLLNARGNPASAESTIRSTNLDSYEKKWKRQAQSSKEQAKHRDVGIDQKPQRKNTTQSDGSRLNGERRHNVTKSPSQSFDPSEFRFDGSGRHSQLQPFKKRGGGGSKGGSLKSNTSGKSSETDSSTMIGYNASIHSKPQNSREMRADVPVTTQTSSDNSQRCNQKYGSINMSQQEIKMKGQNILPDAELDQPQELLIPEPDYPEPGYIGLINYGLNCCLNSLIQTLFRVEDLHKLLQQFENSGGLEDHKMNVPHQLYQIFCRMRNKNEGYVSGQSLIKCLLKNRIQANEELDAEELLRQIFSALKTQLDHNSKSALSRMFTVSAENFLDFELCGHSEVERTHLLTIPLPVLQPNDLPYQSVEEALKGFFSIQFLNSDSMVYCQKCEKIRKACQGCKVLAYSPIVCLHLKRFTLDYNTGRPKKLYHYMTFPQELKFWSFLKQNADCPEKEQLHSLFSVVVHCGNASSGHYLVYIRNKIQDRWHRINDTSVERVSWEDVEKAFGNTYNLSPETAYLLFYKSTQLEITAF